MIGINEKQKKYRKQTRNTLFFVAGILVFLISAYGIWFGLVNNRPWDEGDPSTWGTFGDFIGGILNPVVALCALYWLTRSIEIQQQELSETKNELAETRKLIDAQVTTAAKQRFEDTFFALLDQHNAALKKLNETSDQIHNRAFSDKVHVRDSRASLHSNNQIVGHYFRILYQVLKLIALRCPDTSFRGEFGESNLLEQLPSRDEKFYSNIVRSFLDMRTTQLLAVNCYCVDGKEDPYWNYKCLVERYAFLEHMPLDAPNMNIRDLMGQIVFHYDENAFDRNDFLLNVRRHNENFGKAL